MSKISISVSTSIPSDQQNSAFILSLSRCLERPIQDIKAVLVAGHNDYLYRAALYQNNHVQVDEKMRTLLSILEDHKASPYILELLHDESWHEAINLQHSLISGENLLTLLDEAQGQYES